MLAGFGANGVAPGDTWHLDEVFCKINGRLVYLWRAVDQSGEVSTFSCRSAAIRKLLKGLRRVPRAIVTDKLASYTSAKKDVIPDVAHHHGRRLNNRAENSHQPTRERERAMRRFKSTRHAQRFLSVHARVANHFRPGRHLMRASNYRSLMTGRFASWSEITGARNSAETSL
jgi:putative transposase